TDSARRLSRCNTRSSRLCVHPARLCARPPAACPCRDVPSGRHDGRGHSSARLSRFLATEGRHLCSLRPYRSLPLAYAHASRRALGVHAADLSVGRVVLLLLQPFHRVGDRQTAGVATAMKVIIVGAGVAGLAIGWRLVQAGASVEIVERGQPGRAATWAAAGMLAPGAEKT